MDAVECNLADPLLSRLAGSVDVVICNPPYVPTPGPATNRFELSYAGGGECGRSAVIDALVPHVAALLSPQGLFYLVALHENNVPELQHAALRHHSLHSEILLQRQCGIEHLYVLKFSRKQTNNNNNQ